MCGVCFNGDSNSGNEMVVCDKCDIAVHQACYGVRQLPVGKWLCRVCQAGLSEVSCVLCPGKKGALKPTTDGRWAHVLCGLWIPETQFSDPAAMEPLANIDKIPALRWKLTCNICQTPYGACIQCSGPQCRAAFHPLCCQAAGFRMEVKDDVVLLAYCSKHDDAHFDEDKATKKFQRNRSRYIKENPADGQPFELSSVQPEPTRQVPSIDVNRSGTTTLDVEQFRKQNGLYSGDEIEEKGFNFDKNTFVKYLEEHFKPLTPRDLARLGRPRPLPNSRRQRRSNSPPPSHITEHDPSFIVPPLGKLPRRYDPDTDTYAPCLPSSWEHKNIALLLGKSLNPDQNITTHFNHTRYSRQTATRKQPGARKKNADATSVLVYINNFNSNPSKSAFCELQAKVFPPLNPKNHAPELSEQKGPGLYT